MAWVRRWLPLISAAAYSSPSCRFFGSPLMRRNDENAMRYLFRAWRARNPKRGLHMLRCYLQLLWPGDHLVEQLYQLKAAPYPQDLGPADTPDRYLTSRVRVAITSSDYTGADVEASIPSIRSVVPARIVLEFTLLTQAVADLGIGCAMAERPYFQQFTGTMGLGSGVTVNGALITSGGAIVTV